MKTRRECIAITIAAAASLAGGPGQAGAAPCRDSRIG